MGNCNKKGTREMGFTSRAPGNFGIEKPLRCRSSQLIQHESCASFPTGFAALVKQAEKASQSLEPASAAH